MTLIDATTAQLLVPLVVSHVLGDFLLQSGAMARAKRRLLPLLTHTLAVTAITYTMCGLWKDWRLPVAVFTLHALIDGAKARLLPRTLATFLVDQAAHLVALVAIAIWIGADILATAPYWGRLLGEPYYDAVIVVGGIVLVTRGAGFAIGLGVQPFLDELAAEGRGETDRIIPPLRGLHNGGRAIGYLERALIFVFVLAGMPQGVGFLLAAKSILRFGEIKEPRHRMEAEYIIIGTLGSFVAGLLVAFATRHAWLSSIHSFR